MFLNKLTEKYLISFTISRGKPRIDGKNEFFALLTTTYAILFHQFVNAWGCINQCASICNLMKLILNNWHINCVKLL